MQERSHEVTHSLVKDQSTGANSEDYNQTAQAERSVRWTHISYRVRMHMSCRVHFLTLVFIYMGITFYRITEHLQME